VVWLLVAVWLWLYGCDVAMVGYGWLWFCCGGCGWFEVAMVGLAVVSCGVAMIGSGLAIVGCV
jgi:hypothetical protein